MKTLVIYKSQSGFVKKYAEWISQELKADIFESSKVNSKMLMNYNTIIYGGGLYAVGISGVNLIKKNLDKLKGKKVVVFGTGASPYREDIINDVKNRNFTAEQQKHIRFFYLRGGFDYNKLKPFYKLLMKLMKSILEKKKELTSDEKGMLDAYSNPADFTDKENIKELISYVNSSEK
jgi:flavodoxin